MTNKLVALFVLLAGAFSVNAQNQTPFQDFIEETFENKLSNISSYADVAPLMQSFSSDFHWVNVKVDIDGKVSSPEIKNREELSNQINYLAGRPALSLAWKIEEYHELSKRENSRIASLKVKVSILVNNEMVNSGYNVIKVIAKKKEDHYVIKYMDILQVSSKSYLGPCYVRLTSADQVNFDADIAYPDGNDYGHHVTEIQMISAEPFKAFLIKDRDQRYYWNPKTNDVTLERQGRKIGNASDPESVVIMAISNESKNTCNSVIRTAKKAK